MLKQLDSIQLTLPETRLNSFSTVMLLRFLKESCFAVIFAVLAFQQSCIHCQTYYWDLPQRPTNLQGWKKTQDGTVLVVGAWMLNKGESTEGKTFGVTLLDVQPAQLCGRGPFGEPGSARVTFKFYRASTKEALCQTTIDVYGTNLGGNLRCPENADLPPSISIDSYNAKDGWVAFSLAGTVGDIRW